MADFDLHELQQTELQIMDVIHDFCQKHHLRYSIVYGSLLGAVRHKGFIPWDDDMDICMPRDDYEKFIMLWNNNPPDGYILQYKENSPEFSQNFVKIRKDHTTFMYFEDEANYAYHKGIFIDVFPGDKAPDGKVSKKAQYLLSAVMLLYYRGFTSGNGGIIGLTERILLSLPAKWHPLLRRWAEKGVLHWNGRETKQIIFPNTITEACRYFNSDIFEHIQLFPFEDRKYYGFSNYDEVLTTQYGNYMQLPPKDEQVLKHHPYLVDFESNYEELI